MEVQAIDFDGIRYCTVFTVQNHDITVLAKSYADSPEQLHDWLERTGFPTMGDLLRTNPASTLPNGFYINPRPSEFCYAVNPENDELTGVSRDEFQPLLTSQRL